MWKLLKMKYRTKDYSFDEIADKNTLTQLIYKS